MAVELVVTNGADTYTHDPTPSVVISSTIKHDEESGIYREREVIWTITGVLTPAGGLIADQVAELEEMYHNGVLDSAKVVDGSTELEIMPDEKGIRVTGLDFPEGSGPEWATKRQYIVTLNGSDYSEDVTSNGEYDYNITYATEQSGIVTRTITGSMRDLYGKDSAAKYAALKTTLGWSTWAGANQIDDTYTENDSDTETTFTLIHRKYFKAYPSSITNADVTREEITDEQDTTRYRVSGWFEGPEGSCNAAINNLRPLGGKLTKETKGRNEYTNRTSFTLDYLKTIGSGILYEQEHLTISEQLYGFVHKRVLGGGRPIKQKTSLTPARAAQIGTIRKANSYPNAPAPHWSDGALVSKNITRTTPRISTGLSEYDYEINYSYEFEFDSNPGW